jgi:hypothetical protein
MANPRTTEVTQEIRLDMSITIMLQYSSMAWFISFKLMDRFICSSWTPSSLLCTATQISQQIPRHAIKETNLLGKRHVSVRWVDREGWEQRLIWNSELVGLSKFQNRVAGFAKFVTKKNRDEDNQIRFPSYLGNGSQLFLHVFVWFFVLIELLFNLTQDLQRNKSTSHSHNGTDRHSTAQESKTQHLNNK